MADESISTPSTATEPIPAAVTSTKPYDMLDAYEAEPATTESLPVDSSPNESPLPDADAVKEPEKTEEASEKPEGAEGGKSKEGDKVDDGFESVPVTKTINGKEVTFTVKDAITSHVKQEEFNRQMDQRITTVAKREQAWRQDHDQFKSKVGEVIKVAQSGDFVTAIKALAKVATNGTGLDVTEFEKQYFSQLDEIQKVYSKLSPEQKEAYFAKRAAAEAQARAKELEDEKTTTVAQSQLQAQVTKLQEENGFSNEEWWGNYKALAELGTGEGKPFKTREDITAEDVVRYSLQVRHEQKVFEAGKKLGVSDEEVLTELSRITSTDPTLTADQIAEVLKTSGIATTASSTAVENLNRKAEKSKTRFNQASSTKKENEKIEGYDKESLDFLYRKQPRQSVRPVR